jgi:SAM-dependent methyltransferase
MIKWNERSGKKELLDADNIPFGDIKKNMAELETINRLLGGHAITIKGLKAFAPKQNQQFSVCELGCGGGDNLKALDEYARREKLAIQFIGVDIKKACINYAAEKNKGMEATWICCDYQLTPIHNNPPDIIFSSLFCHHFSQKELVAMMQWMYEHSSKGFFINDLQRHPMAWFSIRWLTRLFSRSYLVKNDAPLSVLRGFSKKEWQEIFRLAGISNYTISWQWAFRYLVICKK